MSVDEKSQRSQRTQRSTQRSQRSQQSSVSLTKTSSTEGNSVRVVRPKRSSPFGRAKLRIIQTLGVKQKTKYPDTFLAGMEELENYTKSLQKVANDLCGLLQQNPKFLPEPLGKMEVEPPAGQDPFEQLGQTLNSVSTMLDDKKLISRYVELTAKLAEQHREFQKSGRRVIHSIRTFLNVNYIDLIDMRKDPSIKPTDQTQSTSRIEIRAEELEPLDTLALSIVTASDCDSARPIRNSLFVDNALLDSASCMNLDICDICHTPILGTAANPKHQWIKLLQSLCGLSELPEVVRVHDEATIEVLLPSNALVLSRFSASTLAVLSLAYEQLDLTDQGISLRRQRLLPANVLEGLRNLVGRTEVLQFVPLDLLALNAFYFPVLSFNNGRLRIAMST
ncbi:hypothetical protein AAVH_12370 [Aphelenchoides avenae]|nr:hypothetical protein AAVH_12370 [Aphelenchus avenae]